MTGLVDVIVCLWFLPVTLFVILPLAMLLFWSIAGMFLPRKAPRPAIEKRDEAVVEADMLAKARA